MKNWLKSRLRKWLWPKLRLRPNLPDRKHLGVTQDSMEAWFKAREYKYLMSLLSDELDEANVTFVAANPNDAGHMGKIQATIKYLRWMLEDMKDEVMDEVKEAEIA